MISLIRRQFCKHDFMCVKQNEYRDHTVTSYMCKKCGWIRTIRTY
jgi:hypothetical protein